MSRTGENIYQRKDGRYEGRYIAERDAKGKAVYKSVYGNSKAAESGKRALKWSEFMFILFVIWNNDIGKGLLDNKGLFPSELKKALSVNRNAHAPETEAGSGRQG